MEREENTEASDDNERGEAEKDNDVVEHIANANGDDADDEISNKNHRIRTRNVSTGGERKSLLFLIPHLKGKKLAQCQRMLLK